LGSSPRNRSMARVNGSLWSTPEPVMQTAWLVAHVAAGVIHRARPRRPALLIRPC
jgi:hypothetical protein